MTQEEKDLLLRDLSARLPYGVKIYTKDGKKDVSFVLRISDLDWIFEEDRIDVLYDYDGWKPYLRPMSSMTEVERNEYGLILCDELNANSFDWLNAHHFDYRGLIDRV